MFLIMFRGINTMDFEENREMSEFARISNLMGEFIDFHRIFNFAGY